MDAGGKAQTHDNSSDDFVDEYKIETVTKKGTKRERRSKQGSNIPNLTPDAIALKELRKRKRVKRESK